MAEGMLQRISDEALDALERQHEQGITSAEILDIFAAHDIKFSEATLRKYVQLGLLPRSVRVGAKGKNRGSQGLYPATVVRRIETIRRLMGQGYTIEEIQKEFFFIRGDIEELSRSLTRVYGAIERALLLREGAVREGASASRGLRDGRVGEVGRGSDELARKKFEEARRLGDELLRALDEIAQRASLQARLKRAQV